MEFSHPSQKSRLALVSCGTSLTSKLVVRRFPLWSLETFFLEEASHHWKKSNSQRPPCCEEVQASHEGKPYEERPMIPIIGILAVQPPQPGKRANNHLGHNFKKNQKIQLIVRTQTFGPSQLILAISPSSSHSRWGHCHWDPERSLLHKIPPKFLTHKILSIIKCLLFKVTK